MHWDVKSTRKAVIWLTMQATSSHVETSILPNAVEAMEYLDCMAFPSIVRPIQDMERVAKCECLPCMEKVRLDDQSSIDSASEQEPTDKLMSEDLQAEIAFSSLLCYLIGASDPKL